MDILNNGLFKMLYISVLVIIVARLGNGCTEKKELIEIKGWLRKVIFPVVKNGRSTPVFIILCIYIEVSWIVYIISIYFFDVWEIMAQGIWLFGLVESFFIGAAIDAVVNGLREWEIGKMIGSICIGIFFIGIGIYLCVDIRSQIINLVLGEI